MGSRPKDDLRVTPPPRLDRPASDARGRPVTEVDVDKLQTTLDKVVSAVNKSAAHTERIPDIEHDIKKTGKDIVRLETKMDGVCGRVEKVEAKVDQPHDCFQVGVLARLEQNQREASQKIETDVNKGIEQKAELAALSKEHSETAADVEDIKKAPRRMFYGLIGLVLTVFTLGAGGLWFLAELNKDVEHEREVRIEQYKRIETGLSKIARTSNTAPVKQAISKLTEEVEESNGHAQEFELLCDGMQSREKRQMRDILMRRGKRVPRSCL